MVSTKGRYALRTMIDIARNSNGNYVPLKDISKREDISMKYLEQVVSMLVRANLLIGLRGSKGGYKLIKDPKYISTLEILEAMEGSMAPIQCLKDEQNKCVRCGVCTTVDFWRDFDKTIKDYLESVSLYKLVQDAEAKNDYTYSI